MKVRLPLVLVLMAAAGLVAVAARSGWTRLAGWRSRREVFGAQARAPHRRLEERLAYSGAASHRPFLGSAPPAPLSLRAVGALARSGDEHGAAVAFLLGGEANEARTRLAGLRAGRDRVTADLLNDEAAAALAAGDLAQALELLDAALADGDHAAALFNRALALRRLDLRWSAATLFARAAASGAPGWADEAAREAARLRAELALRVARWDQAQKAGAALALQGIAPTAEILKDQPDALREWLYDGVRVARTSAELERLLPVARALDAQYGGQTLEGYVAWAARQDFATRAPLALRYRTLVDGSAPLEDARDRAAALVSAARAQAPDIAAGAVRPVSASQGDGELLRSLGTQLGDPWFELRAAELDWDRANGARRYQEAEGIAAAGLARCQSVRMVARCVALEGRLAHALSAQYRVPQAERHLGAALALARRHGLLNQELDQLKTAAKLHNRKLRGAIGRAHFEEVLSHGHARCLDRRMAHEELAWSATRLLRPQAAVRHLAAAPTCAGARTALTTTGLLAAAKLRRFADAQLDRPRVLGAIAALERVPPTFFATWTRGMWTLHDDLAAGRPLLVRSFAEMAASLGYDNGDRRLMESEVRLALAGHAARRGAWPEVLLELMSAAGVSVRTGCVLGLGVDLDEAFSVLRTGDGTHHGLFEQRGRPPLPGSERPPRLAEAAAAALAGCDEVKVVAPAKQRQWVDAVGGSPVPWSYLLPTGPLASGPALPPPWQRLVIAEPQAPAALGLPPLAATASSLDGARVLRGRAATPSAVRAHLAEATLIEFHAHGVADAGIAEQSAVVLSPDESGRYLFGVDELRGLSLARRPIVFLATCRGAARVATRPDSSGLAGAFVRAGARAVYAATEPIPDAASDAFFTRVREALTGGASPALALVRARRTAGEQIPGWARSILLFE